MSPQDGIWSLLSWAHEHYRAALWIQRKTPVFHHPWVWCTPPDQKTQYSKLSFKISMNLHRCNPKYWKAQIFSKTHFSKNLNKINYKKEKEKPWFLWMGSKDSSQSWCRGQGSEPLDGSCDWWRQEHSSPQNVIKNLEIEMSNQA